MNLEYLIYITSASTSILLAVLLLFIVKYNNKTVLPYTRVSILLALGLICRGLMSAAVFITAYLTSDMTVARSFIIPEMYYLELVLFTFSALALLHSPLGTHCNVVKSIVPAIVLVGAYLVCFLLSGTVLGTVAGYENFTTTFAARLICLLLYMAILVALYYSYSCLKGAISISKYTMEEVVPAGDYEDGMKLIRLARWFAAYLVLSGVNMVCFNHIAEIALAIICTCMAIGLVVAVINCQLHYYLVDSAMKRVYENKKLKE
ncbi:hypothetical protein [Bacteroides helcogenes]|uniref:Uncharacterized protein n=1 Tax=Bacteroides helcogenes (strain ATCC 35417 / DSM 20613 / JCM 6297 / CCUG 15421 / P 36-108) TaxID=693979 RepID=E6SSB2_BACT6|nr:hypothetical protein [Bacteroides helcogenes]ADV45163.1 hypothetical protein Bache_3239 [Bacteroides helcogenes P 36-108]MDY5238722.1 hypothetical protein [Bacteroides helcogenes]